MHTVQIEPIISYFIIDDLALGINLSYYYQKIENNAAINSDHLEQTFVGPLGKYYFGSKKLRPYIQADYLFLVGDNFEGGELGIGAGIFYHITGNFGMNAQFKYGHVWSNQSEIENQNRMLVGIGLAAFIF
jgi:predicted porin